MATRLFLHAAANALSGTFPTAEQSVTFSARYLASGANTLRTMDSLTGVAETSLDVSISASATYEVFWGHFCTPLLAGTQTIGASAQELTLNIGRDASSSNASATAVGMNLYVWRPGTGAVVGTVYDGLMLPIDINISTGQRVFKATISAATSVVALDGDVLIVEAWQRLKPASALPRRVSMYYDGPVVLTTHSASSSSHAAFLNFANDTLAFQQPAASASFAQTLGAVTLQGVGSLPIAGTFNNTLATVALTGAGAVPAVGTFNNTLGALSLSASGLVGVALGSFDNTLDAVTLAGTGALPVVGAFSNTLASVSLSASAAVPVVSTFDNALAAATLAGTGEVVSETPVEGTFDNALADATLAATGEVVSLTPAEGTFDNALASLTLAGVGDGITPVVATTPESAGGGASRAVRRRKFVVPSIDQRPYVDRMFDDLAPAPPAVEVPKVVKRSTLIADSLAAMAPTLALQPAPAPVELEKPIEQEDDAIMIMIAMLL